MFPGRLSGSFHRKQTSCWNNRRGRFFNLLNIPIYSTTLCQFTLGRFLCLLACFIFFYFCVRPHPALVDSDKNSQIVYSALQLAGHLSNDTAGHLTSLQKDECINSEKHGMIGTAVDGGFNNQREVIALSWAVAYYTRHTMNLRDIQPSAHDSQGYDPGDVWIMSNIEKYVKIERNANLSFAENAFRIGNKEKFKSQEEVEDLTCFDNIYRWEYWGYLYDIMPFMFRDELVYSRMMESFKYNEIIQSAALEARQRIGEDYYGIHWRLGDSPRKPLFDCRKFGFKATKTAPWLYDKGACVDSKKKMVGMEYVFDHILTDETMPLYISTNNVEEVGWWFGNHTKYKRPYTVFEDLGLESKYNNVQTIAIEQLILAESIRFIPALHSSFSEWVVYLRRFHESDLEEPNYEIWHDNIGIFLDSPEV